MDLLKEMLNKENSDYAKECFEKALEIGFNFKLNNVFKEKKYDLDNFKELLQLPMKGIELKSLLDIFEKEFLPYCSNFGNETFMGFPDCGNSIAGISGAIISDFLQQNLINSNFCAPIATYIEIAVIKWFREILGYKIQPINDIWDIGGIITYGGTGSNSVAMMLARENSRKNTMKEGIKDPSKYKVIIPKGIGHYSIKSSCMWIGCGDSVIEVETNNFKYNLKELERVLDENKGNIIAVVAYVGDSRTMTIENLKEVYNIVKKIDKNIWLHADACHGFSLAFSKTLKKRIEGIELFDSISTDPHKVLTIPYCVSALLIKDPEKFKLITSYSDLIMNEPFSLGKITPFIGSKSWVSLKIWFMIKNIGIENIGKIIEKRCEMAKKFGEMIQMTNDFILLNDININSVVFMYTGDNEKTHNVEELNNINKKIHMKMLDDGLFHLHFFTLFDDKGVIKKGKIVTPLRYMSGNPNLSEDTLKNVLDYIRKISQNNENSLIMNRIIEIENRVKINFAENRNYFMPNEEIKKKLGEAIKHIYEYPDCKNIGINKSISEYFNINTENFIITKDSLEGINFLARIFNKKKFSLFEPTFWGFKDSLIRNGVELINIQNLDNNLHYNLIKLNEISANSDILYLCNPNNPTLSSLNKSDLIKLISNNPNCHYIIDESMLLFDENFAEKTVYHKIKDYDNLSVILSFSKILGIAGLRLGIIFSNKNIISQINKLSVPYSIGIIEQYILPFALSNKQYIENSLIKIKNNREFLIHELKKINCNVIDGNTNFILVEFPKVFDVNDIENYLKNKNIYIRNIKEAYPNLVGNWIRITIHTIENNKILINELKKYMKLD